MRRIEERERKREREREREKERGKHKGVEKNAAQPRNEIMAWDLSPNLVFLLPFSSCLRQVVECFLFQA